MKTFYIKEIIEAGVDEAGRGPLFGRVYAAAVILNPEIKYNLNLIKDSKKISKKKLPISESYVKQISIDWSVGYSTAERIDEINIFGSNTNEMCEEIRNRYPKQKVIIFPDGNQLCWIRHSWTFTHGHLSLVGVRKRK